LPFPILLLAAFSLITPSREKKSGAQIASYVGGGAAVLAGDPRRHAYCTAAKQD
jgi:hypothetical protein